MPSNQLKAPMKSPESFGTAEVFMAAMDSAGGPELAGMIGEVRRVRCSRRQRIAILDCWKQRMGGSLQQVARPDAASGGKGQADKESRKT